MACVTDLDILSDLDPNDEVGFWLDMIQRWRLEKYDPVPHRMYQALELAVTRTYATKLKAKYH